MHDFGKKLKPGPNPPAIVDTPWNSMVLQFTGKGDTTVTGAKLFPLLQAQAGFNAASGVGFDIKIQSVRVWSLTSGMPIRLSCYGFTNTSSAAGGALCIVDDWPSRLAYAAVGYEFPASVQNIVYSQDSDSKICHVDVAASNDFLAYFNILWRGNKPKPFSLTARYLACTSRLNACAQPFVPTAMDISPP